jgi:hypothetical protein
VLAARLIGSAVVALAAGCSSAHTESCDGLQEGDVLAITILGSGNDPSYPCTFGFDLMQGQVLNATVVNQSQTGNVCVGSAATIAAFGAWTWTLEPGPVSPNLVLDGTYTASNGSCSGTVTLWATYGSTSGQFSLNRAFVPSGSGSPSCQACSGEFAVTIQKVSGP